MEKAFSLIFIGICFLLILTFLNSDQDIAHAQMGPSTQSTGDALWHLPKFGEQGWFIHAHNGKVRACNMNKTSIVGERPGPRCSNWE